MRDARTLLAVTTHISLDNTSVLCNMLLLVRLKKTIVCWLTIWRASLFTYSA